MSSLFWHLASFKTCCLPLQLLNFATIVLPLTPFFTPTPCALSIGILFTPSFLQNTSSSSSSVSRQNSSSYSGIPSTRSLSRQDLSSRFRSFAFNSFCTGCISLTYAMRSIFRCFIELTISTNVL